MKCMSCGEEFSMEYLTFVEVDMGLCEECAKEVENEIEQEMANKHRDCGKEKQ